MNRFKGLGLVDRVPEELCTVIIIILIIIIITLDSNNTILEAVIKTISKKKKCKKAKWLSDKVLQIAEERREVKGKEERERYTQLNAEVQRIAKRDKNVFLNEQWEKI